MQTNTQPGTTAALNFFSCNTAEESLFSVRSGVSAKNALTAASCFLDLARTCAYEGTESGNLSNAAAYLIEMAKAVVDSLTIGIDSKPNERETAFVFERLTALHENGVLIINPQAVKHEVDDAQGFLDWAGQQAEGGAQ